MDNFNSRTCPDGVGRNLIMKEIIIYEDYGEDEAIEKGPEFRFNSYAKAIEWLQERKKEDEQSTN